jgi:ribonuclease G
MAGDILIDRVPGETRIARMEGGRLAEIMILRDDAPPATGQIFLGRINRVVPGLDAAFVELGQGAAPGLLAARDAVPGDAAAVRPINRLVHEGERIIVQITRQALGDKGPRLSADIALPGRLVALTPRHPQARLSPRIAPADSARLSAVAEALADDAAVPGGVVLRTRAQDAGKEEIIAEAHALARQWAVLETAAKQANGPVRLFDGGPAITRALAAWSLDPAAIRIEGQALYNETCAALEPGLAARCICHDGAAALFEEAGVEAALEAALSPRVALEGGGWLMIEETEALVAIDVNTGGSVACHGSAREAAVKTNLTAAREIARQLRLRNLGGLVVIDFLHLEAARERRALMAALRAALAGDRAPIRLSGLSQFGLVELTRRRTGQSLSRLLGGACPQCGGRRAKAVRTIGQDVLRQMARCARRAAPGLITVRAAPAVIAWLEGSAALAALQAELARAVSLEPAGGDDAEMIEVFIAG